MRLADLRCTGPAWVLGWAVAVFLTSALLALALHGASGLPAATWRVADETGPAAKLLLGLLLALFFAAARRVRAGPFALWAALAGLAAMLLTLALVPAGYSRGFGIGLTGARFDTSVLLFYATGGLASGLAFGIALMRCRKRAAPLS